MIESPKNATRAPSGNGPTPAAVAAAVRSLEARLPAEALVAAPENPFAALASDRYGLASLEDARRLETPEGRARLARQALKRCIRRAQAARNSSRLL